MAFSYPASFVTRLALSGLILILANNAPLAQENLTQRHVRSLQVLDDLRKDISISNSARDELAAQIDAIEIDRQSINGQLISASKNARKLESRIERTSTRYSQLENQYDGLKKSLSGKSGLMAEILAALQRMGRNPPPALLISPKDALESVRSAILLGSVVPEIRSQTEILLSELREMAKVKSQIEDNRSELAKMLQTSAKHETQLTLLIQEKKNLSRATRAKLAKNEVDAARLAAKASSVQGLINQLEAEIDVVKDATRSAKDTDKQRELAKEQQIEQVKKEFKEPSFTDNSRIEPAIAFTDAKKHLPRPVNGVIVQKFGKLDGVGEKSKTIAIATRTNARVISPADGWVVYSGPFKSYGQMLILNVGSKHHIILSGMENINVELGQFVLLGEPVGIMGTRRIASAQTLDIGLTRPVLSIEFRNDGASVDPGPWWLDETKTKVEQ